jgi:hypothetical protein
VKVSRRVVHEWEVNGNGMSGYGYRCSCGARNIGVRYSKESAAIAEILAHIQSVEKAGRLKALDELAAQAQELDMGY